MDASSYQDIKSSLRQLYLDDPRPWLVGFSGGKDNTMLAFLILQKPNPWGGDNRPLYKLYANASSGECPIQIDTSTPSCANSRFGCWTCTVVDRDKASEGLTTLDMESIVDAAHIHEFSDSRNNDPRNGLALSKNAHWQFDRGLWSITNEYRVIVNPEKFIEEGIPGQKLADIEGHRLFLPSDPKYWPEPTHLAWHRRNNFTSSSEACCSKGDLSMSSG